MSTIKDVARLAGVSHGTVSNVINGYNSVKSDIVRRVEAAIKELGYQPNLKARSMRNSKTNYIGVLLPNITDNINIRIYNGVERVVSKRGYSLSLYISNGSPETEEIHLSRMQQQRIDGAVIITCMPRRVEIFEQLEKSGIKLIFVRRKPAVKNITFFGIDEKQALYNAVLELLNAGFTKIALLAGRSEYSNESDCTRGYKDAMTHKGSLSLRQIVENISDGKENAFRAAVRRLHQEKELEAIIATCPEHAMGILTAVRTLRNENRPIILSLDNNSWVHAVSSPELLRIFQDYNHLGEEAAKKLLFMIESENKIIPKTVILPPDPFVYSSPPVFKDPVPAVRSRGPGGKTIRILMLENTSSLAGKLLKPVFTRETGIEVEIETRPYEAMFEHSLGPSGAGKYDLIQINIPWINESVKRGIIIPLNSMLKPGSRILQVFPDEILALHGMTGGQLYAVPFLVGVQLLFYRKDIFRDLRIRRLYYEKTKNSLEVPATWKEYDRIAQFFTGSYNSESPVPYGTTLGRDIAIYYYILRLWEAGISFFDGNSLKSPETFKLAGDILDRYYQVFSYADPDALHWTQAEQANQFCRGNSAMMVIYQAHFADHVYNFESSVYKENIGFAPLPSRTSIVGGWSLGLRKDSKMKKEALCFLEWLCGDNNSFSYNILGGSIPSSIAFNSFEMLESYPWLSQTIYGIKNSRPMVDRGVKWISQWEFESSGEKILNRLLDGKISAKKTLEELWQLLSELWSARRKF
jgi:DNA-binding LacI/PurR family transcriptional regulator/ABC-type glycerol-3-phosphate transport system substrate-binding protein